MQVQSFEEACQLRGYDANTVLPEVSNYPVNHQKAMIAFAKLVIINEAMNEGKKFDWNDYDQNKYYPWFDLEKDEKHNPSGFRFYAACYGVSAARARVAALGFASIQELMQNLPESTLRNYTGISW